MTGRKRKTPPTSPLEGNKRNFGSEGTKPSGYTDDVPNKVREYIKLCKDTYQTRVEFYDEETGHSKLQNELEVKLPTKQGLAKHLGITLPTLKSWAEKHDEMLLAVEELEAEQHDRLVNNGLGGKYNPSIAKLILSSNHGYAENKSVKHSGGIRIEDLVD